MSISLTAEKALIFRVTHRSNLLQAAEFFDDPAQLDRIDWDILRRRDFRRDHNDPAKVERYQAELLAFRHVPVGALLGVACCDRPSAIRIEDHLRQAQVTPKIVVRPDWYF